MARLATAVESDALSREPSNFLIELSIGLHRHQLGAVKFSASVEDALRAISRRVAAALPQRTRTVGTAFA